MKTFAVLGKVFPGPPVYSLKHFLELQCLWRAWENIKTFAKSFPQGKHFREVFLTAGIL